jgi:hypothetical protein
MVFFANEQPGSYKSKNGRSFRSKGEVGPISEPLPVPVVWEVYLEGKLLGTVKAFGKAKALIKAAKEFSIRKTSITVKEC